MATDVVTADVEPGVAAANVREVDVTVGLVAVVAAAMVEGEALKREAAVVGWACAVAGALVDKEKLGSELVVPEGVDAAEDDELKENDGKACAEAAPVVVAGVEAPVVVVTVENNEEAPVPKLNVAGFEAGVTNV